MRIDYTGRQMEITPDLRQHTEEHLRKLVRLLGEGFGLHVILTAEKHRRIAELALAIRDHTVLGIEETGDARTAMAVAQKLGIGEVEAATIRTSVNPVYDRLVLATAKTWRYKPATLGGEPVKFRKMIQLDPRNAR